MNEKVNLRLIIGSVFGMNFIDKVIVFRPLTHEDIKEIVKLHIGYLEDRLEGKKIKIELTPGGLEILAKESYDPKYGARPVRRKVQELVEDVLTQMFLDGEIKEGDKVKIVKKGSEIEVKKASKKN